MEKALIALAAAMAIAIPALWQKSLS